jgi:L-ornithine N5-oxygenase
VVTGDLRTVTTPRVVLATGHEPYVPEPFQSVLGDRVFHSSSFSHRFDALRDGLRSVLVIGAGQNAGEILLQLHGATDAELFSVVRNSGFRLYDLGHFANQAYWPGETDYFYELPAPARAQVFDEQYRTNYAAVDPDVSTGLYNAWYDGEVSGRQRLNMIKRHELLDLSLHGDTVTALIRERYTGEIQRLITDAVILATGFREQLVPRVLLPLEDRLVREGDGRLALGRDFRVALRGAESVDVYLHGMSERRHGIASATSFSLLALRAGEIVASVRSRLTDAQLEEEEHADLSAQ